MITDDERYAAEMISAGHSCDIKTHTWTFAFHRPKNRILVLVYRIWEDVKILVDSYVIEKHPCCGMPNNQGHALGCQKHPR